MGASEAREGTETVATREWVIREIDADGVVVDRLPDGGRARLDPSLLPDDVAEGDRFRVVAQVDRRGPRVGRDGPAEPGGPARLGGAADHGSGDGGGPSGRGDEDADEVPDAVREALRNLT